MDLPDKVLLFAGIFALSVQGQKVAISPNEAIYSQMGSNITLKCEWVNGTLSGNKSITSCAWIKVIDPWNEEFNQKFECKSPNMTFIDKGMSCGGNFTVGSCNLDIKEAAKMKHQGNWTCQLQLASSLAWTNSSNYVMINVHSEMMDIISAYLGKFLEGLFLSIESITNMIEEIDM